MAEALLRRHGGGPVRGPQRRHGAQGHQPAHVARPRRGGHRRLVGPLEVGRRVPRPVVRLRRHGVRPGPPESARSSRASTSRCTGTSRIRPRPRAPMMQRMAVFRRVFGQLDERIAAVRGRRQPAGRLMLLHLLRHAHAGDPGAWDGPDADRPLSDKGRAQADRLGAHLVSIGFRARRDHRVAQGSRARDGRDRGGPPRRVGHGGRAARPDGRGGRRRGAHRRRGWPAAPRSSSGTTRTSATSCRACAARRSRCARAPSPGSTSRHRWLRDRGRCAG